MQLDLQTLIRQQDRGVTTLLPPVEVSAVLALTPPHLHSAAVRETCAWFTDNYEQARK